MIGGERRVGEDERDGQALADAQRAAAQDGDVGAALVRAGLVDERGVLEVEEHQLDRPGDGRTADVGDRQRLGELTRGAVVDEASGFDGQIAGHVDGGGLDGLGRRELRRIAVGVGRRRRDVQARGDERRRREAEGRGAAAVGRDVEEAEVRFALARARRVREELDAEGGIGGSGDRAGDRRLRVAGDGTGQHRRGLRRGVVHFDAQPSIREDRVFEDDVLERSVEDAEPDRHTVADVERDDIARASRRAADGVTGTGDGDAVAAIARDRAARDRIVIARQEDPPTTETGDGQALDTVLIFRRRPAHRLRPSFRST